MNEKIEILDAPRFHNALDSTEFILLVIEDDPREVERSATPQKNMLLNESAPKK